MNTQIQQEFHWEVYRDLRLSDFFKKLSSHIVDKKQLPFHTAKAVIQLTHHLLHMKDCGCLAWCTGGREGRGMRAGRLRGGGKCEMGALTGDTNNPRLYPWTVIVQLESCRFSVVCTFLIKSGRGIQISSGCKNSPENQRFRTNYDFCSNFIS